MVVSSSNLQKEQNGEFNFTKLKFLFKSNPLYEVFYIEKYDN